MEIINFAEQNSIINHYMAELRDKSYQKNRLTFRHNVERIGEMMAYELSKTLEYKPETVTTPLGQLDIPLTRQEDMVIATVLRAGLPFHQGFLNVFDKADNAFVSAYRMYLDREHTQVGIPAEYGYSSVEGKTLLIVDPMLATGGSLVASIKALMESGKPKKIHLCCVIAAPEGIEEVKKFLPDDSTIWIASIDEGMNEHKYIVPGFGDCGDLCFGDKLQSFRKIAEK